MRQTEQQKRLNALAEAAGEFIRKHTSKVYTSGPWHFNAVCHEHGLLNGQTQLGFAKQAVLNHYQWTGCMSAIVERQ
jgi:hypothetical protein